MNTLGTTTLGDNPPAARRNGMDSLARPDYTALILRSIENGPGRWNYIEVGVFRGDDERREQIGSYVRNYPTLLRTFYPFRVEGCDYALYSRDYTASRVMALPTCRDLGGEESSAVGFCPADYYVPCYVEREGANLEGTVRRYRVNEPEVGDLGRRITAWTPLDPTTGQTKNVETASYPVSALLYYPFGFVAGCIWGDDSSWKIQYLDLSRAGEGVITRTEKFGYIALPDPLSLKEAIDMTDYATDADEEWSHRVTIAIQARCDLNTGQLVERGAAWDE